MSESDCARCGSKFEWDPANAIDHLGHLFVFSGYCQDAAHRNYVVLDSETLDSVIIAMSSNITSSVALESRGPKAQATPPVGETTK